MADGAEDGVPADAGWWRSWLGVDPDELFRRMLRLPGDASRAEVARRARPPEKFLPTLLSFWQEDGSRLTADQLAELDAERRRQRAYDAVAERLVRAHSARVLKGHTTARLYPPGIVRRTADLDVCLPPERLWDAVVDLADEGWAVEGGYLRGWRGELIQTVVLSRDGAASGLPERVDLSTVELDGDHFWVPPRHLDGVDPALRPLVLLLEERLGRPYFARDLIDAAVLLRWLTSAGNAPRGGQLHRSVQTLDLVPEWNHLLRAMSRVAPGFAERTAPDLLRPLPRGRRRLPGLVRSSPAPDAVLARSLTRLLRAGPSPPIRWLAAEGLVVLQHLVGGRRLLNHGVALFGVIVNGAAASTARPEVAGDSRLPLLPTPVGTFALVAGERVPSSWLARPERAT